MPAGMAVVAVLASPNTDSAPDSAPRRLVSALPDVVIELLQFDREASAATLYFLMRGVARAEFEAAVAADPGFSAYQQLERTDDGAVYRVRWTVDSPVIRCLRAAEGIVLRARGTAEEWRLTTWFDSGSAASAFQACCRDRDIPLEVERLTSISDVLADSDPEISERQREALVLAYRAGYFDEPRQVTQAELADELDISSSALGRRLRRGFRNLIQGTLLD